MDVSVLTLPSGLLVASAPAAAEEKKGEEENLVNDIGAAAATFETRDMPKGHVGWHVWPCNPTDP